MRRRTVRNTDTIEEILDGLATVAGSNKGRRASLAIRVAFLAEMGLFVGIHARGAFREAQKFVEALVLEVRFLHQVSFCLSWASVNALAVVEEMCLISADSTVLRGRAIA